MFSIATLTWTTRPELALHCWSAFACQDVLEFWKGNETVGLYPSLCQLARLHLSSSATSVSRGVNVLDNRTHRQLTTFKLVRRLA